MIEIYRMQSLILYKLEFEKCRITMGGCRVATSQKSEPNAVWFETDRMNARTLNEQLKKIMTN